LISSENNAGQYLQIACDSTLATWAGNAFDSDWIGDEGRTVHLHGVYAAIRVDLDIVIRVGRFFNIKLTQNNLAVGRQCYRLRSFFKEEAFCSYRVSSERNIGDHIETRLIGEGAFSGPVKKDVYELLASARFLIVHVTANGSGLRKGMTSDQKERDYEGCARKNLHCFNCPQHLKTRRELRGWLYCIILRKRAGSFGQ
jgi:hypothetical protein